MKRRFLMDIAGAIAVLAICLPALAGDAEVGAKKEAEWSQRLEKAAELQAGARARQAEADQLLARKHAECLKIFLVISCQKDADAEHLETTRETRLLTNQGKAIERQVRKEKLDEQDRQRGEQAPQREAELLQREAETADARESAAAEEAATRVKKAQEAEEGARRKAKEAERALQKQQAHEAKLAQKKAAAERRNAAQNDK